MPGIYELPGGHIDYGEDIVDGLKREIMEEFGMRVEVGEPFAAFTYRNDVKGSHSVEVIYHAHFVDPLESIKLHPEDHSEFRWLTESALDEVVAINREQPDDPEMRAIRRGFELLRARN